MRDVREQARRMRGPRRDRFGREQQQVDRETGGEGAGGGRINVGRGARGALHGGFVCRKREQPRTLPVDDGRYVTAAAEAAPAITDNAIGGFLHGAPLRKRIEACRRALQASLPTVASGLIRSAAPPAGR
ncbi:hypothetical protein LL999_20910 [Burkholderia ambifaria]|uniref:hypothetical protein n=1 Tax=Burkholderia ambifaria TaxID=152480 RepID=UPI001E623196|nr:hypothetical protein [Burkholderia ambifaria]UEP25397.1 hypothetical protein LL999_20910 [Burkholderia ambifaria]